MDLDSKNLFFATEVNSKSLAFLFMIEIYPKTELSEVQYSTIVTFLYTNILGICLCLS